MRPSLRPSRDVHGLTRTLGEGAAATTKRPAIQGRPWPGTVWLPGRNSSMADDKSPPEGETSLGLNPDEPFIWHVVCLLIWGLRVSEARTRAR